MEGTCDGWSVAYRRAMGSDRAFVAQPPPKAQGRAPAFARPEGVDRNSIRAQNRYSLGRPPKGKGLRVGHDLLATPEGLAGGLCLGTTAPGAPGRVAGCGGQRLGTSSFLGAETRPNPTDRRKKGFKHHILTDAQGSPLVVRLTGANRHGVTQPLPRVETLPPIRGRRCRPLHKPMQLVADSASDSWMHPLFLHHRGITPLIARRRHPNGCRLGKQRWVVERALIWLHQNRRLRVRYEKRADFHQAFMTIGSALICWKALNRGFC